MLRPIDHPPALGGTAQIIDRIAWDTMLLPSVLGQLNVECNNLEEEANLRAVIQAHHDSIASRISGVETIIPLMSAFVESSTVAPRCVIPLVDKVLSTLMLGVAGATAAASIVAFKTKISAIIATIVRPSFDLISFLGSCWMYLSDDANANSAVLVPPNILAVFGMSCTYETVSLLFYAVLLQLTTLRAEAHVAAAAPNGLPAQVAAAFVDPLNVAAAAGVAAGVAAAAAAPVGGGGASRFTDVMRMVSRLAIGGFAIVGRFFKYLCAVPEFICIGLGGVNPSVAYINNVVDNIICSLMVCAGEHVINKHRVVLSAYLQQQYLLSVFDEAVDSKTKKLNIPVFKILCDQETQRLVSDIMARLIDDDHYFQIESAAGMCDAVAQVKGWILQAYPRCMDRMITEAQVADLVANARRGASDRKLDDGFDSEEEFDDTPGAVGSAESTYKNGVALDAEECLRPFKYSSIKRVLSDLFEQFLKAKDTDKALGDMATICHVLFDEDWGSELSARPVEMSPDERQAIWSVNSGRYCFQRIIKYTATYVLEKLVKRNKFGKTASARATYKTKRRVLDGLMRISDSMKDNYMIGLGENGRLAIVQRTPLNVEINIDQSTQKWLNELQPPLKPYTTPLSLIGKFVCAVGKGLKGAFAAFDSVPDDAFEAQCEVIIKQKWNDRFGPDEDEDEEDEDAGAVGMGLGADEEEEEEDEEEEDGDRLGMGSKVATRPNLSCVLLDGFVPPGNKILVPVENSEDDTPTIFLREAAGVLAEMSGVSAAKAPTKAAAKWAAKREADELAAKRATAEAEARDAAAAATGKKGVKKLTGRKGGKSRKNSKKTTRRNKGRKSSKTAKKSQQPRARNSIRRRRSSRKGRK